MAQLQRFGWSGPAIHGRAFAPAVVADRATTSAGAHPCGLKLISRRVVTGADTGWKRHLRTAFTASRSKTRAGVAFTTRAAVTVPSVPTVYSTSTEPEVPARRASAGNFGAGIEIGRRSEA